MTIDEAKQVLRDNWTEGIDCPCCGQLVKKYPRKLTSSMAKALISLYNQSSGWGESVHIKKIKNVNGGEFAQLKRWGLITDEANEDTTKRRSGLWSITSKGVQFIKGEISVPMYCDTYNGKTLGFSKETTTIQQALGNRFDYAEMMGINKVKEEQTAKAISWIGE